MNLHRLIILLVILSSTCINLFAGCASEPNFPAGLPHGEIKLTPLSDPIKPGARLDFETGTIVYEPDKPVVGDVFLDRKFLCGSGAPLNVGIQDTQPQSIGADPTAPTDGYTFPSDASGVPSRAGVYTSHVYWFKLTDGKYAKVKVKEAPLRPDASEFDYVILEWVYQPDGTTNFFGKPEAASK